MGFVKKCSLHFLELLDIVRREDFCSRGWCFCSDERHVALPGNMWEIKNSCMRLRHLEQQLRPEWKRRATVKRLEAIIKCFVIARAVVLSLTPPIWFGAKRKKKKRKINTSCLCIAVMFQTCTQGLVRSQNYCLLVKVLTTYFTCIGETDYMWKNWISLWKYRWSSDPEVCLFFPAGAGW